MCWPRSGRDAVVVPLLLADAYHARVDIPAMIEDSGAAVEQADVLGEDDRLLRCCGSGWPRPGFRPTDRRRRRARRRGRLVERRANARTASVAALCAPEPVGRPPNRVRDRAAAHPGRGRRILRGRGAEPVVIAPWFLAHGRITDRVANYAGAQGIPMAEPLGSHNLVAATVLDRFDAVADRAAA